MPEIVILGAGLTGLVTAYYLKKDYQIFEKEATIGGLCRSEQVDGFTFDYTGHLLHFKTPQAKQLVFKLLKGNLKRHRRRAFIFSFNTFIKYPFQLNFFSLPPRIVKECIEGLTEARRQKPKGKIKNFEDWINYHFGKGIARYFMLPYNRKLWRVPLKELLPQGISQYIPKLDVKNILKHPQTEKNSNIGYNAYFYYPIQGGIASLPKAFLPYLRNLKCNQPAQRIFLNKKEVVFKNGARAKYKYLVSTLPLPLLIRIISDIPSYLKKIAQDLEFTSVYNINLGVEGTSGDKHWCYYPEPKFPFYRVGFSSNFSPFVAPLGKTALYVEISYSKRNPLDRKEILAKLQKKLIAGKVISPSQKIIIKKIMDIKYAYILPNHRALTTTQVLHKFLRQNNIYSIGRFGSWKYLTMEDCILVGIQTAQELNK
jgi:protoporphyrinogen oxidase